MKSSYFNQDLNYGDIITAVTKLQTPTKIVEFGILDGFSLEKFIKSTDEDTKILAYDIFEDFNGNSANETKIKEQFKIHSNVIIDKADFYEKYKDFEDESIDILHIDIANNGDTYKFALDNYTSKLKKGGLFIFEGGSQERDNIEWMVKYDKPKIKPVLENIKHITLGKIPSITIIKKDL